MLEEYTVHTIDCKVAALSRNLAHDKLPTEPNAIHNPYLEADGTERLPTTGKGPGEQGPLLIKSKQ